MNYERTTTRAPQVLAGCFQAIGHPIKTTPKAKSNHHHHSEAPTNGAAVQTIASDSSNAFDEWIECRDANDKQLFLYSPVRDMVSIKKGDLTSEIDLQALRREGLRSLLERLR